MDTTQFRTLTEAQVGDKYRLGAEVPPSAWDDKDPSDVYDCSELVQVMYGAAGVRITDGAWLQYDATTAVAHGHERVGDLVFLRNNPARPNGIGHVGIITRVYTRPDGTVYDARIVEAGGSLIGVVFSTLSKWRARSTFAGCRQLKAFHEKVKEPAPTTHPFPLPAGHYFGPDPGPNDREIHNGTEGPKTKDHVKRIQRRVGAVDDGTFGPRTFDAVKAWERRHDVKVNGLVGEATWKAMHL